MPDGDLGPEELTCCKAYVHQTIQQRKKVCVQHIGLLLSIIVAKGLVEGVHRLGGIEALLIEGIVESRYGYQSTCEREMLCEELAEVTRVEGVLVDCSHLCSLLVWIGKQVTALVLVFFLHSQNIKTSGSQDGVLVVHNEVPLQGRTACGARGMGEPLNLTWLSFRLAMAHARHRLGPKL